MLCCLVLGHVSNTRNADNLSRCRVTPMGPLRPQPSECAWLMQCSIQKHICCDMCQVGDLAAVQDVKKGFYYHPVAVCTSCSYLPHHLKFHMHTQHCPVQKLQVDANATTAVDDQKVLKHLDAHIPPLPSSNRCGEGEVWWLLPGVGWVARVCQPVRSIVSA